MERPVAVAGRLLSRESKTMSSCDELTIRSALIDDLPSIFHLGEQLFTSREFPNLYRTWDEYEVVGLFQSNAEHCVVAVAGEELLGFALGTTIEKQRTAWNYGYLVWLGVEPTAHRRGIATRLLDEFATRMKSSGVRMLMVDTQADNESALRFFKRHGFANPTDHVYLTLALDSYGGGI